MASNRRDYKQASRAALERLATAVLEGGDVAAAAAELERQVARPTQDVRQEILSALDLLRRTLPEGSAQIAAVADVVRTVLAPPAREPETEASAPEAAPAPLDGG